MSSNFDNNILIDAINDVIRDAILHGGDPGGPYFSYADQLGRSMEKLAKILGVNWTWSRGGEYTKLIHTGEKNENYDT